MTNYLNIDFQTFKQKAIEILQTSNTFKDFDYEGSNISVLIELLAYQAELNVYYQNKIAKNVYLDSADLYNTIHRLSKQNGYQPKGTISGSTTLTITLSDFTAGDQIYIPSYTSFSADDIKYLTTIDYTFNIPLSAAGTYEFNIDVKQGEVDHLEYSVSDLIDYQLTLPEKLYDYDDNNANNHKSIKIFINDIEWTRIDNFYENISGLVVEDDVYVFEYSKDRLYKVLFSPVRNYPTGSDTIDVYCIESLGTGGAVGQNTIVEADVDFIQNITELKTVSNEYVILTNANASVSSADPETIPSIRNNAYGTINSQYRCVTKNDFNSWLETRSDVDVASVWGEKEQTLSGDIQEYNKIHITVIPTTWSSSTISISADTWQPADDVINIDMASTFNSTFQTTLSSHIEPRKILNTFEVYEKPNLIYFYFEIGLRIKSLYNFSNVALDVRNKILYYFDSINRSFNETIDFRDIKENILDTSIISSNNSFTNIVGIKSFEFRDFSINSTVYDYEEVNYPRYSMDNFSLNTDNVIRPIQLGYNQFPAINENLIIISNEG